MKKLLILLTIFLSNIALAEPIEPDGEIDNVLVTFFFFEDLKAMRAYLMKERGVDFADTLGYSECWRHEEKNMAVCDIYVPRPREVDGRHTTTIGHEILHGVYGQEYHQ